MDDADLVNLGVRLGQLHPNCNGCDLLDLTRGEASALFNLWRAYSSRDK